MAVPKKRSSYKIKSLKLKLNFKKIQFKKNNFLRNKNIYFFKKINNDYNNSFFL